MCVCVVCSWSATKEIRISTRERVLGVFFIHTLLLYYTLVHYDRVFSSVFFGTFIMIFLPLTPSQYIRSTLDVPSVKRPSRIPPSSTKHDSTAILRACYPPRNLYKTPQSYAGAKARWIYIYRLYELLKKQRQTLINFSVGIVFQLLHF